MFSGHDEAIEAVKQSQRRANAMAPITTFLNDVQIEYASAREKHPRLQASFHEGYAVLLEEVEEVWEIVKLKASKRDHKKLREELVQVAAMALRMAVEAGI